NSAHGAAAARDSASTQHEHPRTPAAHRGAPDKAAAYRALARPRPFADAPARLLGADNWNTGIRTTAARVPNVRPSAVATFTVARSTNFQDSVFPRAIRTGSRSN